MNECIEYSIVNYGNRVYIRHRLKELKGIDKIIKSQSNIKF